MLYGIPFSLLISGWMFPLGVIIYWVTNNLISLAQQAWVLHKYPPPASATAAKRERVTASTNGKPVTRSLAQANPGQVNPGQARCPGKGESGTARTTGGAGAPAWRQAGEPEEGRPEQAAAGLRRR